METEYEASKEDLRAAIVKTTTALMVIGENLGDPAHNGHPMLQKPGAAGPAPEPWPVLDPAALHGLAGDVVRLLGPCTEADDVALLTSFLSEFGTIIGPEPHLELDGARHTLRIWPVLVGQSSKSRKGTAARRIQQLFERSAPGWTRGLYKGTLSSGEGLVYAVRDAEFRDEPVKVRGKQTGEIQTICVDPGVEDKRLHLTQSEFGAVLKVMARTGNSLSGVIRDAWDGNDLCPMTKGERIRATAPHIGIIGHVTKEELLRHLDDTEASNGFANRFLWLSVRRSKELPFPVMPPEEEMKKLAARLGASIMSAKNLTRLDMTNDARDVWQSVYSYLSADQPGLAGALLARSESQTMRLGGLYAALDGQPHIDRVHLLAALALMDYVEASTRHIFGGRLGDPVADVILRAIKEKGALDNSEISALFGRHETATRLDRAKASLAAAGLIHVVEVNTGGRPRMEWRQGAKKAN